MQYGYAILLDFTWDVARLVNCSKTFHTVLEALTGTNVDDIHSERQDVQTSLTSLQPQNERCLKTIIRCTGGNLMSVFVDRFIARYPRIQHQV
jgi:hypothetical protein